MHIDQDDFFSYLTNVKHIRLTTLRIHRQNIKTLLQYGDVSNRSFESLVNARLADLDDYERQTKYNTLNTYVLTFNNVFSYLEERKIPHDLTIKKYFPKFQPEIIPLSVEEIRLLLEQNVSYAPRNRPRDQDDSERLNGTYNCITRFLIMTGARINETLEIRCQDVNLLGETVRLKRVKGRHPRNAYLFDPVLKLFKEYYCFGKNPEDHVFQNLAGKKVDDSSYREYLAECGKSAGINQRVHPHLLRHSFANILLQRGARLVDIADLLGHSDINITKKLYIHLTDDEKRAAAGRSPLVQDFTGPELLVKSRIDFIRELEKDERFDKEELQEAEKHLLLSLKKIKKTK